MWSPDGRELLAIGTDDEEIGSGQFGLFIAARHGAPRRITDDDLAVAPHSGTVWSDEGRIVFLADSRGQSYLYSASYDGGSVEKIVGGGVEITELAADADARRGVIAVASPDSAGDLFAVDIEKGSRSRLTHFNEDFFDEHQPGGMEKFAIVRAGLEIESRLVLPPEFDRSSRYAAIVDIHGGPASRFGDTFKIEQQVLATAGYVVLAVNPRGSSSYGDEFMKAVLGDWGGEDYLDIMAAVDELSARPYIDETRLGVTGYSYGGYMTAWIAGHDDRFKAAVVGAPCINLYSMYGTSDIGVHFGDVNWGGSPDQVLDFMLERSPLRYASEVQTPVLLMHGVEDLRCPIAQSEEYFVALKRLKKEVQMVRFPGCSHGFLRSGRPKAREEYLGRMLAWLDKHLQVSEAGAPSAEAH
jgi:dipeptidyl aminopeptidase/acylaminoacyl peptidase